MRKILYVIGNYDDVLANCREQLAAFNAVKLKEAKGSASFMARKMIIEVSKKNYHPGTTVYFISNNTHVIKATVMSISGGLYTLSFRGITNEGTAAIRLKASRLYATAEEAKAHLPAHVRERKIAEEKRKESERGFAASGWH